MAPANNYVKLKGWIFSFQGNEGIAKGTVGFNNIQRTTALLSLNEPIQVATYLPEGSDIYLFGLKFEVDFYIKSKATVPIDVDEVAKIITRDMLYQFFQMEQKLLLDFQGTNLQLRVVEVEVGSLEDVLKGEYKPTKGALKGVLMRQTNIQFVKAQGTTLRLTGGSTGRTVNAIIRPDWNFESMGIGGLDKEFSDIFRRAFASRVFPQAVVSKLGIKHVKGLLLYGPPGTGKTLMARQIGKMLNGKEPKIVNGPEILNKYVGQSEENIRNLFKEAEQEYKERQDESDLHIIIFDEIDAVCVSEGTLVSRFNGTSMPIEQITDGASVLGHRTGDAANASEPGLVAATTEGAARFTGEKPCVELTLEDGRTLVCTPDHRILTAHGWVEAEQLQVGLHGDRVLCGAMAAGDMGICAQEAEFVLTLPELGIRLDMATPAARERTLAFARILGALLTDGTFGSGQPQMYLGHQLDVDAFNADYALVTGL